MNSLNHPITLFIQI